MKRSRSTTFAMVAGLVQKGVLTRELPPLPPRAPAPVEEKPRAPMLVSNKHWLMQMVAFVVKLGFEHHRSVQSGCDQPLEPFVAALGWRWAESLPSHAADFRREYAMFFQREMLAQRAVIEDTFPSEMVNGVRIFRFGLAGAALTHCTQYPPTSDLEPPAQLGGKTTLRVRFRESEDVYFRTCAQRVLDEIEARGKRPPLLYPSEIPPLPGMDAISAECYRRVISTVGPGLATNYDPAFYWARTGLPQVTLPALPDISEVHLAEFGELVGADGVRMLQGARTLYANVAQERAAFATVVHSVPDIVVAHLQWAGTLALVARVVTSIFTGVDAGPVPTTRVEWRCAEVAFDLQWRAQYDTGLCSLLSGSGESAVHYYRLAHEGFARHYFEDSDEFLNFLTEEICVMAHHAPSYQRVFELVSLFNHNAPREMYDRMQPVMNCARRRATENEEFCVRTENERVAALNARYAGYRRAFAAFRRRPSAAPLAPPAEAVAPEAAVVPAVEAVEAVEDAGATKTQHSST